MKIAIIVPCELEIAPFLAYYADVFDAEGVDYFFITWKRNKNVVRADSTKPVYEFPMESLVQLPAITRPLHYMLFARYAKKILKREKPDLLVVSSVQSGIFLYRTILKNFSGKYIFDVRDYFSMQKYFGKMAEKLVQRAAFTVISSHGYYDWMPKGYNYVMGHNVKKAFIDEAIESQENRLAFAENHPTKILTIGKIRDVPANKRLIDAFKNSPDFELIFAGSGEGEDELKQLAEGAANIRFLGGYVKSDEIAIVNDCDVINILLSPEIVRNRPMANRFYLAVMCMKPIFVVKGDVQADYFEKYPIGITINDEDDIAERIREYQQNFQPETYRKYRLALLNEIKNDVDVFETAVRNFIKRTA